MSEHALQSPVPNAYTLAISGRKPFVVLHTSLLELLTPAEVQVTLFEPEYILQLLVFKAISPLIKEYRLALKRLQYKWSRITSQVFPVPSKTRLYHILPIEAAIHLDASNA